MWMRNCAENTVMIRRARLAGESEEDKFEMNTFSPPTPPLFKIDPDMIFSPNPTRQ
jgi:hypothetical protein